MVRALVSLKHCFSFLGLFALLHAAPLAAQEVLKQQSGSTKQVLKQRSVSTEQVLKQQSGSTEQLDEVVVTGTRSGPMLWRVSKDDHEMWILGTTTPLPRKMKWDSTLVNDVIAESGAVLMPPNVRVDVKIGFFGGLMLLPKALKTRNNTDKQKLVDLLPPELYQRWLAQKKIYRWRSKSIEKRRPFIAANELYDRALRAVKLDDKNISISVVKRAAKKNRLKPITPELNVEITDAKNMLNEFLETGIDDRACFEQTLSFVEKDLPAAKQRADAWADGQLAVLRKLPLTDFRSACVGAIMQSEVFKSRGFTDLPERLKKTWLEAADNALKTHTSSFALLPMRSLIGAESYMDELEAMGYQVDAPRDVSAPIAEQVLK
jgi:hypothetical protein